MQSRRWEQASNTAMKPERGSRVREYQGESEFLNYLYLQLQSFDRRRVQEK